MLWKQKRTKHWLKVAKLMTPSAVSQAALRKNFQFLLCRASVCCKGTELPDVHERAAMSRRRVSVKDLGVGLSGLASSQEGQPQLPGKPMEEILVRPEEEFSVLADKAEGFINLCGFTIEQAKQCRKKHAITASHPLVVTIFIAAESFTEMNKWISKLSEAADRGEEINTEECYSEDSDQEGDDCTLTSCPPDPEQETEESENGDGLQPLCEASSSPTTPTEDGHDDNSSSSSGGRRRSTSEGAPLCRNSRRRAATHGGERLSWQEQPRPEGAERAVSLPLIHINEEEEVVHEKPPDEMESLYNHLRAASLSPIGGAKRKDFRASFIRRCENNKMNESFTCSGSSAAR
ncbi:hypothetical protein D5F01_LYC14529 [Larimichthys crocea]|uniref:PH domain-containing protein n=1 Tax=Larimichthys crocea TaxID=215358 RepID=A0A6G0I534_LARCR|nr:hypothetical protein D5F01_LYC14529 [Larimichthys crocea]